MDKSKQSIMNRAFLVPSFTIIAMVVLLLPERSKADPRSQTVDFTCGTILEHNTSIFVPNFVANMENISNQVRNSGFGIGQTGSPPDGNFGLGQCYGDLSLVDCVLCFTQARSLLPQCYPFTSGTIYLDGCFSRSDNYSFFHEYTGPNDRTICGNITRNDSSFEVSVRRALSHAVLNAPNSDGYARAEMAVSGSGNGSVYVLANCWRTLSVGSCRACLENAFEGVSGCLPSSEGRALNTGCFVRYSDMNFLNPIPGNGNSRGRVNIVIGIAAASASVLIIGALIGAYIWKHKTIQRKRKGSGDVERFVKTLHDSSLNFKYSTLEKATGSFDEANKLGHGGFGTVYRGVLQDGREIAVKRLFYNNRHRAGDFYNEVNIISSVEHKNLVRLLGCSCSGPESLLVYEFLPNKSLDQFIFDSNKGKSLDWVKRLDIIIATAEGLVYLHENTRIRIIHRDIKASNILLDLRLRAKIADFGLARSFQEDKSHISTAIAGTLGYMAPEYLAHGQLTEKADVYSFGVLVLEIVTGRENNRSKTTEYTDSLVTTVWKHFQRGTVVELVDPNLMLHNDHNTNIKNEILRVVHVGLLCTQENPTLRPFMSKALEMLVKQEQLPTPTRPPFMDENTMELNDPNENPLTPHEHGDGGSVNGISNSIFLPR